MYGSSLRNNIVRMVWMDGWMDGWICERNEHEIGGASLANAGRFRWEAGTYISEGGSVRR
jgi:hypothetical protein